MTDEISSILEKEANAVRNIPVSSNYAEAVNLIVEYVHARGGKLVTSGMGKAGQIAMNIATTFSSTGTPAFSCIRAKPNMAIWVLSKPTISCY